VRNFCQPSLPRPLTHVVFLLPPQVLRTLVESGNWLKTGDLLGVGRGSDNEVAGAGGSSGRSASAGAWCWVGDVSVIATAELGHDEAQQSARLLRHFVVFSVPAIDESTMGQILTGRAVAHLRTVDGGAHVARVGPVVKELCRATASLLMLLKQRFPVHGARWCHDYRTDHCAQVSRRSVQCTASTMMTCVNEPTKQHQSPLQSALCKCRHHHKSYAILTSLCILTSHHFSHFMRGRLFTVCSGD
jgi:hypothetical protein